MRLRVGIFHPIDPVNQRPSGISTVIRTLLKYAPEDLDYTLFGASSDPIARPVGRECVTHSGGRSIRFLPVVADNPPHARKLTPLCVRYIRQLQRHMRGEGLRHLDVLDFHRVEPLVLFRRDTRPKNLTHHQDMSEVLLNKQCDIRWKHAPWLYHRLEHSLLPTIDHMFCVRQSAVGRYQLQYPALAASVEFLPTWVDTEIFRPASMEAHRRVSESFGLSPDVKVLISVGRLELQKDPLLLLDAVSIAAQTDPAVHLLMIGDGSLRRKVQERIRERGMSHMVTLLGARQPSEVAELLQGADLLVLSSAYEGMPIVVLEALASGIPVVTTRVGEVERVVRHMVNGALVQEHDAASLGHGLCAALEGLQSLRGLPCEHAVIPFHPERILSRYYENHRRLALAQQPAWAQA